MLLLAVAACRESGNAPAKPAAEPVAAVQAMALRLAEDDLVGYARLSVPPSQYQRLQQAWNDQLAGVAPSHRGAMGEALERLCATELRAAHSALTSAQGGHWLLLSRA